MHPMLEFGLIIAQYGLYVIGGGLAVAAVAIMINERM